MRTGFIVQAIALIGCGSGIAPEPDPAEQLWAEACVRLSGCEPYASRPDPLFACQVGREHFSGTGPAECALAAADCDAAVACFGNGAPPVECPDYGQPHCEGDVLVVCDPRAQIETARDCAGEGLRCRLSDWVSLHCAREGDCTEATCDGNVLVECLGGIPVPRDCGRGRCVMIYGVATCAGEGEACEGRLHRCDGDVAVSCDYGFIHREQCRPGACSDSDGAFCRDTDECRRTHCDGAAVVFCVEGRIERYDCTAWGFTECVESAENWTAFCR